MDEKLKVIGLSESLSMSFAYIITRNVLSDENQFTTFKADADENEFVTFRAERESADRDGYHSGDSYMSVVRFDNNSNESVLESLHYLVLTDSYIDNVTESELICGGLIRCETEGDYYPYGYVEVATYSKLWVVDDMINTLLSKKGMPGVISHLAWCDTGLTTEESIITSALRNIAWYLKTFRRDVYDKLSAADLLLLNV